ncbi:RDD family protein [Actinoallomurus rhizosphaericola]|uniref:RDD family protein n=1 Tax=Actinoallomurus rhizosphaericola TaxID=2952536 RepID=UPI002093B1D9|nr:RDD family protein [Actinoallomurus rhizosphaericola]MCO5995470.1 RDD family protein [Actinoallomurus rhizosphaericola]
MYAAPQPPPYPVAPLPEGFPAENAAPPVRRLAAWAVDTLLLWGAAVLLAVVTWGRLHGQLVDDLPFKAVSAAGGLLVSGGDVHKAAADFGTGLWDTFASDVEQALVLLVVIQLLYQFALNAWLGRTLGKAAADLRVRTVAGDGSRPGMASAFRRALVTTAGGTGLYCLAWILLLEGLFLFALAAWLLAVAVFVATGLPALFGGRRTLADLLAGTTVVRAHTYQRVAATARQGAALARDGAQAAGQAARDAAREQAARLAQTDALRRALDSQRAHQARDMGRRLGGRLRNTYRERSAGEAPPFPAPGAPALPPPRPRYDPLLGSYDGQSPQARYVPPPAPPPAPENRSPTDDH